MPYKLKPTQEESLKVFGSPLIGFFHNGKLTAITVRITDYKSLDQASIVNEENVKSLHPMAYLPK